MCQKNGNIRSFSLIRYKIQGTVHRQDGINQSKEFVYGALNIYVHTRLWYINYFFVYLLLFTCQLLYGIFRLKAATFKVQIASQVFT